MIDSVFPTLVAQQEGRIPPAEMLDPACITRNILADKPRVTRFPIDWNAASGESGGVATDGGTAGGGMEDEMGVGEDNVVDDMVASGENEPGDAEVGELVLTRQCAVISLMPAVVHMDRAD